MRYLKPHYYDKFRCIADRCPDSCCEGWQIMIDDASLERYEEVEGAFGARLMASIDWKEGAFRQCHGKCSFLNEKGLCDLQATLGEDYLCKTCAQYPRHVEEYEGLREWSLSLSCPVAAEMILLDREPFRLLEEETEEEEELAEEFEDFDLMMFSQLEEARDLMFGLLGKQEVSFEEACDRMRGFVRALQDCMEEERYYDVDEVIESFRANPEGMAEGSGEAEGIYEEAVRGFSYLNELERLREDWTQVLENMGKCLYEEGEEAYLAHRKAFLEALEKSGQEERRQGETRAVNIRDWDRMAKNMMYFFLYTYFCGAVYDDWIYSKYALAEFSVRSIRELVLADWMQNKTVTEEQIVHWAYRYAREIEHSDENLNCLEELLTENPV